MAFYAVGADPIRRFLPRALVLLATTGRTVMLRDAESLRRIDGETLAYAHLGADACLLPAVQRMISPPGDRSGVVFAMNGEHETMLTSSVLRYASDIGETPQLIGMSQSESVQDISNYSFEVAKGIAQIIDYPLSWTDALQTIGNARYLVASRMHALYMGLLTDTPMVAIGRSPKVASFAREFGIPLEEKLETTTLRRAKHGSANALSVAKKRASEGLDLVLESLGVSEPAIVRS
jgi:polysaccharide pyruvyl transferase WcaK-like protein